MLRRLHPDQPDSFAFTPDNLAWAEKQITKYPEGREASAVIPLLWRAQEQEGWLSRAAIEEVARMLNLAYIRVLEVATFYFMFQLQPVGSVAHIQICGTTSCMICGAEDLVSVCKEKIAPNPHQISEDGKLSWEEVECLGSCANAPMAQIGKDYYEDLTADGFAQMLDDFRAGKVPTPGPQNGRYAAEPLSGLTSLKEYDSGRTQYNASVQLATDIGDTVKRIDGTEVPLLAPWGDARGTANVPAMPDRPMSAVKAAQEKDAPKSNASDKVPASKTQQAAKPKTKPAKAPVTPKEGAKASNGTESPEAAAITEGTKPQGLTEPRGGKADNLKEIKGIGPKLERLCNRLGFYHFDQIAAWTADEVAWVDQNLEGFKGRVTRDQWVEQAGVLAAGGETEFSKRVEDGNVY
ncbi:NADH-quinone oxidoreductase subunit E [Shimia ponticola]|uniref:NADH-quinone oxidoreductase subunit E n=1 Tax=Shimia ponticola TaxID=2582893 RepID=UPI0011BF9AFF|nr:NADH-quinone oxidoreductase subunit E [Shimia ponticola]